MSKQAAKETKGVVKETVTEETVTQVSKSQIMREMYDEGLTVGEIAKQLGVRYQFVYQVIHKHTKGEIRSSRGNRDTKSQMFRDLYDKGLSVGEIAKQTNSNYTFVFQVIKRYKDSLAKEATNQ